MEYWDIYDVNKQPTGRTMKRNDWNMKPGIITSQCSVCSRTERESI